MLPIMVRPNVILKSEFMNISTVNKVEKVKIDNNKLTAIQEHILCCNYSPSFENFCILIREGNDFKLKIMESLLTARDKLFLTKLIPHCLQSFFNNNISGYHIMSNHII